MVKISPAWLRRWAVIGLMWGLCAGVSAKTLVLSQALMHVESVSSGHAQTVQLPFMWDAHYPGMSGSADFVLKWTFDEIPPDGLAVYLPKVGNRFEVSVNGHVLANHLAHSFATEQEQRWIRKIDLNKKPHWIVLPSAILRPDNVLRVRIEADVLRKGGLGTVFIGPATSLFRLYENTFQWRVSWAMVVIAFNWTVAAFSLILWFMQTEKGAHAQLYLIAALTELLWSVRMLDALLTASPLDWPWWSMVNSSAYILWIYGSLLFVHHIADIPGQWIQRAGLVMLAVGIFAAALYAFAGIPKPWVLWLGIVSASLLVYGAWFCLRALRHPNLERILIAVAVMINVLVGAHDWWFVRVTGATSGHVPWMSYSTVLFGWSLVFVVIIRYKNSILRERNAAETLDRRISENETSLRRDYEAQKVHLVENERTTERQRVLRDMHDGVGAHLSAAIRQLERGGVQSADLLCTLRDSLDLLKLTVDGMNCEPGDVVGLLANMRYRLEVRLCAAGLVLVWRIDPDVRPIQWMSLQDMQHLRYMIFGVFANILQHAHARQLEVIARIENQTCVLEFCDNGVGFSVQASPLRGLRFMQERAQLMGIGLQITSQTGRTCVILRLPLSR